MHHLTALTFQIVLSNHQSIPKYVTTLDQLLSRELYLIFELNNFQTKGTKKMYFVNNQYIHMPMDKSEG